MVTLYKYNYSNCWHVQKIDKGVHDFWHALYLAHAKFGQCMTTTSNLALIDD